MPWGSRVFAVFDFNLSPGSPEGDFRLARSRETLSFLVAQGARTLLVSHRSGEGDSLESVAAFLKREYSLVFARSLEEARASLREARAGSFVLLENIRLVGGEREMKNDPAFAQTLAELVDIYINEAFSASHRAHTSMVGVPRLLPSYAGFLFAEEVAHLSTLFSPPRPFLVIIGGAKFETKVPILEKFLERADALCVVGALANDFLQARGVDIKRSLMSARTVPDSLAHHPKIFVSEDVVWRGDRMVDAGEKAVADIVVHASRAACILWNGPLGEWNGTDYGEATNTLARALTASKAETIVGGGDTLAAISRLGLQDKFSFVSTGGGAMLQFLADGTLPGLEALTARI